MVVHIPEEKQGFLSDIGAILPDQFTEHFAFVENRFSDGHQIAPGIQQPRKVIVWRTFQDLILIAIQFGFDPVNCQELPVYHGVDQQVEQE